MCIMMENALCPECGRKLLVDKCLSETDAVMKCKHCEKTFNISFDEKTFPAKFNSFNWGAFLIGWIWCLFNGKIWLGILLFLMRFFYNDFNNIPHIVLAYFVFVLVIGINLGRKGNKIAWNHKEWKSVEAFEKAQKSWMIAGIIINVLVFVLAFIRG